VASEGGGPVSVGSFLAGAGLDPSEQSLAFDSAREHSAENVRTIKEPRSGVTPGAGLSLGPETWGLPEFRLQCDIFSSPTPHLGRLVNLNVHSKRTTEPRKLCRSSGLSNPQSAHAFVYATNAIASTASAVSITAAANPSARASPSPIRRMISRVFFIVSKHNKSCE
jgi:hypothetical protein